MNAMLFHVRKISKNNFFEVSSCNVNGLLMEGVIYSPNYDLLVYFINDDLLKKHESFIFTIKIEISDHNSKKIQHFKLNVRFSLKKYFCRFSGLFDDMMEGSFSLKIEFKLCNVAILKSIQNLQQSYPKKVNIVTLESIKGDKIYNDYTISDIAGIVSNFNSKQYYYFISFHGTKEIIGPIEKIDIEKLLISKYYTSVFPILKSIINSKDKLAFFVENYENQSEFFGIFPLSDIKAIFGTDYTNFTVNNQRFNPNNIYPSGTIIHGDLK